MMMAEPNLQTRDNSALLRLQQTHRCLLSRLYISTKPKEKKSSVKMFFRRSHILWILIICEAVSGDYVTKAVNSETAFTPVSGSIAPSTTSIIWKHRNNAGIVVKVIEWDRDDGSFDIPNANFKSHARLDKDTGELTLRNLQLKHTGVYTIDINSKEQRKQFSLTVKGEGVLKEVGDQVSFHPDKFIPPVTSIIWKHINTDGTVVKAIEWDEGEILIPNPRFKGITTVDEKTGQINITNLKVEHSGVYTIDINSKEQEQRFTLTVMVRNTVSVATSAPGYNLFTESVSIKGCAVTAAIPSITMVIIMLLL